MAADTGTDSGFDLPEMSRRRWRVLVIASVGVFLATLDSSILAVALPALSADLKLSFSEALWVQAAYLLVVTVLLIPVGRWAEKQGLYKIYYLGSLVFGLFSVAVALSFDGVSLIVARVFQAVGASMVLTTAAAIVTAVFPPWERGRALGLNMLGATLGQTLGPPVGGVIVSHVGWPWVFYMRAPIVVILLIAGWDLLGAERRDRRLGPQDQSHTGIDLQGAALLGVFLAALFVPLIFSPLWGWRTARTIAPLCLSIVFLMLFVLAEKKARDPIIDLALFARSRVFTGANAASFLYMAAVYGVTIFTAVFLQVVQGRSAQLAGFVLLIQPVIMTLVTPAAGRLSDRLGTRGLSAAGTLIMAAGTAQLALLKLDAPIWQVLVALGTLGLGIGVFSTPNFSAIMGSVDRSRLGVASGMFTTSRFCGMGVSIAILGAIAASKLGPEGGRVILLGARAGIENAEAFAAGYRLAMVVGTGFALASTLASLLRDRPKQESKIPGHA
ncbi:MAG: MFS transporter [Thermoleophilia bacterium]|nr:MFS transporter [Thermoleophilia bacterium]